MLCAYGRIPYTVRCSALDQSAGPLPGWECTCKCIIRVGDGARRDESIHTICITNGLGNCQMGKVTWPRVHSIRWIDGYSWHMYFIKFSQIWQNNAFQVYEKLQISFKGPKELNQIIDNNLPGSPPFKRHEVLVNSEVCEVYYQDIIACICALFGDPDFASVLVFRPEKHYIDEEKEEHMYHDMQTGCWWWCMQVSM